MRPIVFLVAVVLAACSAPAACISVDGDQILGSHLAAADARFGSLPANTMLTYAPSLGKQKTITSAELLHWAAINRISIDQAAPVCFERASRLLSATVIAAAIRRLFPAETSMQIDVRDFTRTAVPPGEVRFTLAQASAPPIARPETPTIWHGGVILPSGAQYPIWANVSVLSERKLVHVAGDLHSGEQIQPSQVDEVLLHQSPVRFPSSENAAMYIGKLLKRSVAQGTFLEAAMVTNMPDILRGEIVAVEFNDGPMSLHFEAQAEKTGSFGDIITLKNQTSLKPFSAVVTGIRKARVAAVNNSERNNSGSATRSGRIS